VKWPRLAPRTLALAAVIATLLGLLAYVAVRSGPMSPVAVTVETVQQRAITPGLAGIGVIEAQRSYQVGPTAAGRVLELQVEVGDRVQAGQVLGRMQPVDMEQRLQAQSAAAQRAGSGVAAAEAQLRDASAMLVQARAQYERYEALGRTQLVSREMVDNRALDLQRAQAARQTAEAGLSAARQELSRLHAEHGAVVQQQANLQLLAPVDGLVTARRVEPGSTVLPGQPVLELVDPASVWVNVRFDQAGAGALVAGLPASVALRSRPGEPLPGRVLRVEPLADAVSEEILAKVSLEPDDRGLPSIGELAEVTVMPAPLSPGPAARNASLQRVDGELGVWRVRDQQLEFVPVRVGRSDRDGWVQILSGVAVGDALVVYSEGPLAAGQRISVRQQLAVAR
jgi:RND family efflux transporter MFP subunit